jgi:O-antigen ligase
MNLPFTNRFYQKIVQILWAILLLSLPLTSFPFFPGSVGGDTLVRPFAIYPLLALLVLATLPALWKKPLPKSYLPLVAFGAALTAGILVPLVMDTTTTQGVNLAVRGLRNLVTLGVGAGLYLSISLLPRSREALQGALRWMYAGMAAALLWGSLQVVYVLFFNERYFQLLNRLQRWISSRRLFEQRISGMTYEPNWFAEQICFLLLPWLLAAVLTNTSLFKRRYRRITVELLLLLWAAGVLVFTFSRAGLFILVVLLVTGALFFRSPATGVRQQGPRRLQARRWVEAGVIGIVLVGVILVAGTRNNYFSRLWRFFSEENTGQSFFDYIAFGQRFTYWESALEMYLAHPVLGVGAGNFAFRFEEFLAQRPLYRQPDLIRQITPTENGLTRLVTPKNLYVRLMAETGTLGTALFMGFLVALVGDALYLWFSPAAENRFWATAALMGVLVFLLGALSFDSFALPNMWVVFGLVTAAAHTFRRPPTPLNPGAGTGGDQTG